MKLSEYNRKRDFNKTAEPEGKVKKSGRELHFVVQKHDASSLHFDFRLEIDGVLVSWAVPKGPSADTKVKRLAMHVEDHPMDYINFEGIIPQGEYGGGTVMVWDTGTFMAEGTDTLVESEKLLRKQLKEGSIKVVLNGSKLKGAYHLVQMKGKDKQWLLLKGKDEFADGKEFGQHSVLSGRTMEQIKNDKNAEVWESNDKDKPDNAATEKKSGNKTNKKSDSADNVFTSEDVAGAKKLKQFPDKWKPQLATLTNEVFDNDDWIFEDKLDGYRALIQIKEGIVNLVSRNNKSFNDKYPELVKAFENIKEDVVLDGEIVVEDNKGQTHFQWLQYYKENPGKGTLKCYVFDILYFNGYDLTGLELLQRKRILEAVLPQSDVIVYSNHIIGKGTEALKKVAAKGGEGLIAKIVTGKYKPGNRSKYWLKIKVTKEQEMVIGGYTEPQGTRKGFGALLIGYYEGEKFIYAGKVGTGFTKEILSDLHARLEKIEQATCPFTVNPKQHNAHWVKPVLVAQIKYSEWTETGSMRHPVFRALRNDKKPKDVKREIPESLTPEAGSTGKAKVTKDNTKTKNKSDKSSKTRTRTSAEAKNTGWGFFDTAKVEITNPDKVFWPKEGITKGNVLDYYDKMAEYLLPFVINRPQSLRRTPDGIKTPGFFQKNVEGMVPNWIKTRKLKAESTQENVEFLLCNDKDTLMFMANWGCIEINPWSSRIGSINNPDYIIFDLDPNKASIKNLVATAKKVKEILDSLGIKGYLKTSGGKGLHVFIPVKPEYTYDHTREFSHIISQFVVKELPEITSLERNPDKREGKVYLDFLQNGKGKTMACAYSLRPREGATASTPLNWDELTDDFDMKDYNISTLPERVRQKGDLWADFFDNAIDLKEVLNKIK